MTTWGDPFFVQPCPAIDVREGDYVLGALHGPSWPLEALRVTRSCWDGNSRLNRRIEIFHRQQVVPKDRVLLIMRAGS